MVSSIGRMRDIFAVVTLCVSVLAGCATHPPLGFPDPTVVRSAPFVVVGVQDVSVLRGAAATPGSVRRCQLTARFEGKVLQRNEQLEVVMPVAWLAVTRNNNKQWDDFHVRVEAGRNPATLGSIPAATSRSETVALLESVDTAAAPLTTWQRKDTLRMSLAWPDALGPRRLHFFVQYHAVGEAGIRSACDAIFSSDTLVYPPLHSAG